MYPHLFTIGDFTVTSFGLMMFLSFVGGAWVLARQFELRGLDPEAAWDMLLWIALGGILGAKLYYVALHYEALLENPLRELTNRGGLVWYGGFIGGVAAFYWQARKRGLPLGKAFDATAPTLAVAYAIGRLGCFLVGDDYGRPTDSWVGIAFPEGYPPSTAGYFRSIGTQIPAEIPDTAVLAVHPTQLYEIALALIMFAVLWRLSGRLRTWRLFGLYLAMYGVLRFGIEFVRAKTDLMVLGLTTSQLASLVLLVLAGVIWMRTRGEPEPATAAVGGQSGRGKPSARR
jgi:phosphatidylglycerol---prolipoprotein diacylglyceryl transferase